MPGGGLAPDGLRCIACRPGFFLPVRALSRLFRRRFPELQRLHDGGKLKFLGEHAALADTAAFKAWLAAPRRAARRECECVVYAKRPFAGPLAVLAYLLRYAHRVAISNSRLPAMDERGVTFRWKDDRAKAMARHKAMTLSPQAFMRRFLLHVMPGGFHRIRHHGLLANSTRRNTLALVRGVLQVAPPPPDAPADQGSTAPAPTCVSAHGNHAMSVLQVFLRDCSIRAPPAS